MNKPRFDATWEDAETARQQCENARAELAHWQDFQVYNVAANIFRNLARIGKKTIIDYGCGAGQYRPIALSCGLKQYTGIDQYYAVAEAAKWQNTADFTTELKYRTCDVLLLACSIEYDDNPPAVLDGFLNGTPIDAEWIILHRVRCHEGPGCFVDEQSWARVRKLYRWNREEIADIIGERPWQAYKWDGGRQWTYLIHQ